LRLGGKNERKDAKTQSFFCDRFEAAPAELNEELEVLNVEAHELEARIGKNVVQILEEAR